jgi:hypothetical protein
MIYRGQLLVRDCGASSKTYSSDTVGTEFRHDYAFVGLAEVDKRRYPEHFIQGFLQSGSLSDLKFQTTDFYQRAAFSRGCDLGGLVHETKWPRPDPLFGIGGGGILFRDCRMPAPEGRKIVLVLAVASLPTGTLLNHHIYDVTGSAETGGAFSLSSPVDSEIPMGESLSTLLKLPLWGWGDEKIGFVSTMDLPSIDHCIRYEELDTLETRTPEQDAELEAIRRGELGWVFKFSATDRTYQAYRREMLKIRPNPRWDRVMSKSEQEAESELCTKVLKRVLKLEECPS